MCTECSTVSHCDTERGDAALTRGGANFEFFKLIQKMMNCKFPKHACAPDTLVLQRSEN